MQRLVLPLIVALAGISPAHARPEIGEPAPPISVDEWIEHDPAGEARPGSTLVKFWGTWCAPCVAAMPGVQRRADLYEPFGLRVVAVTHETREEVETFIERTGYALDFALDTDRSMIRDYDVPRWPSTAVIDAEGVLRYMTGTDLPLVPVIHASLGLPADAEGLLSEVISIAEMSSKSQDLTQVDALRDRLGALCRVTAAVISEPLDLRAWAQEALGGSDTPPQDPSDDATESAALLERCFAAAARGDGDAHQQALASLAAHGETAFDLGAWAQSVALRIDPLTLKGWDEMVSERRLFSLVDQAYRIRETSAILGADGRMLPVHASAFLRDDAKARETITGLLPLLESRAASASRAVRLFELLGQEQDVRSVLLGASFNGFDVDESRRIVAVWINGMRLSASNADRVLDQWLMSVAFARAIVSGDDISIVDIRSSLDELRAELSAR
jgi:peroxiredoxin